MFKAKIRHFKNTRHFIILAFAGLMFPSTGHAACMSLTEALTELRGHGHSDISFQYAEGKYDSADGETAMRLGHMAAAHTELRALVNESILKSSSQDPLLEIGPLHSPILKPQESRAVVYWDRDAKALQEIAASGRVPGVKPVHTLPINLNTRNPEAWAKFEGWNREILGGRGFGGVVISQVLNYVDYRELLRYVSRFQQSGGRIFITNETNRGDRPYFHKLRPMTDQDIERTLKMNGYKIIESRIRNEGRGNRVTIVAEKT